MSTAKRHGGLSNMAPNFALKVNDVRIRTAEALYQACKFPHLPDVQRAIIAEPSPTIAKRVSRRHDRDCRPDWEEGVRILVMRWCLRVKLALHFERFGTLLVETADRMIVERGRDNFWGARLGKDGRLYGRNILGRLLMDLRDRQWHEDEFRNVEPLEIEEFTLFGRPIGRVVGEVPKRRDPPAARLKGVDAGTWIERSEHHLANKDVEVRTQLLRLEAGLTSQWRAGREPMLSAREKALHRQRERYVRSNAYVSELDLQLELVRRRVEAKRARP